MTVTAVTLPAGVPVLDFPKLMQEYLKHDGCLLISDDPNLVEIADQFELMGKPVWRYLAEVRLEHGEKLRSITAAQDGVLDVTID